MGIFDSRDGDFCPKQSGRTVFCKLMDPTDDRHIRKIFARFGMLKTNKRCDYALIIYAPTTKETLKSSFENYSYFVANI